MPPENLNCVGQSREVVDKNPTILLLEVVTLLLAAANVRALVQMRRHRRRAGYRSPAHCWH